jgi:cytochrome c-type biogenesis protein CcmH
MRIAAATAVILALGLVGSAPAAERASLPDIEDEVMCVQCGTALNLSTAAVAERERAFIRREIRRGKTKQQIKDGLVERFGPAVLAMPEDEGFGLAAYLVPTLVALLALVAVIFIARGWHGAARPAAAAPRLDPADERRLERELADHDRALARRRAQPRRIEPPR